MSFVDRMGQNVAKYRIGIRMKKSQRPLFAWMVDVILQNRINKDKSDESQPLLAFRRDVFSAILLKYSKEGRSFSSHEMSHQMPVTMTQNIARYRLKNKADVRCAKNLPTPLRKI